MRELTVRIRFTKHSLGNVKTAGTGRFMFARNPSTHAVTFLASWHRTNMRFAAQVLGRGHDEVEKILWDINVDGVVEKGSWFRRFYTVSGTTKKRFVLHESFQPGQVVGLNCVVPNGISDDDLWQLMRIAGQYKGLSPARPTEYGHFDVVSIRPRRMAAGPEDFEPEVGLKENEPGRTPTSPARS